MSYDIIFCLFKCWSRLTKLIVQPTFCFQIGGTPQFDNTEVADKGLGTKIGTLGGDNEACLGPTPLYLW